MPRTPDTSPQTLRVFEALLSNPNAWRYGYDLSKETGLASGTLYPILMRLAERQLLETRWEPASRPGLPPRHTYQLTADGAVIAAQRVAARDAAPARARAGNRIRQAKEAYFALFLGATS
ncbi:PadR family transcriptional regulator [Micromonospora sp. NBC_01796]|uniref:PadR family transcriptional regulator n=1 Tax=Micromonospora sp. NBC_01796 TaxID=2975987 RepID=UPI002DD7DF86|nr:PadR family transcriptional regulator [Micromonospora sp. NBC_01796]WSA83827.1 PadR family transcriptional regulator [Micromonospora sp. NBC_01796]